MTAGSSGKRTQLAIVGSVVWFALTACLGVALAPWLITGWRVAYPSSSWRAAHAVGLAVIIAGLVPVVSTFVSFVRA